jgi:hypothetical protein
MQPLGVFLVATHLIVGILNIVIARPLILRRIGPNRLYGFRTPKTLGDAQVWYDANEYSGKTLRTAGIATIVAGLLQFAVLLLLSLSRVADSPSFQVVYLFVGFLVIIIPTSWSVIESFRYLGRRTR